ncbi:MULTISPECIES: hypothetical protein [unclassified Streptomyces]|uniref:hypothetical protein n=1 Tax=unclassified Streptomyces TaxID=2593676 RepID=UPI003822D69C
MVNLQELQDLRLGKLGTAVSHWEQTVRKLTALAHGDDGGVNAADFAAKARAADWKGDNATVTKAFTTKTAAQFTDILTEARSIHAVLRDAHTALAGQQRALKAAVDRWRGENITFDGQGRAHRVIRHADNSTPDEAVAPERLQAAAAEIASIVEAASETDRIASRALRRHAKSTHDFDETGYRGLKDADRAQGLADLKTALQLAAKGPEMTDAELKRFNTLIRQHRDNAAFAENFATRLGSVGSLELWRDLAGGPHQGPRAGHARADLLADTQRFLGTTLATASHGTSPAMATWKSGVIAAGDDRIGYNGPYGFQVTSALMRHGTWDSRFLTSYGTKLIEFERSDPGRGGTKGLWGLPPRQQLDYPRNTSPLTAGDPMHGFLQALGHNPEASLDFFRGRNGGVKGLQTIDNFSYLIGESGSEARVWPTDFAGKTPGYAHLGSALESATLGYPSDAVNPQPPTLNTPQQIEDRADRLALMTRVVRHYENADLIDRQDGIRPSLARMAAGHIDSLNFSMDNFGDSGDQTGRDDLYGVNRYRPGDFGRSDSAAFLRALASDQDGYETVSAAQQLYATSMMAAAGDPADVQSIGKHSVFMHGALDEARSEAIGKEFADDAAKRNLELQKQAAWREYVASAVVGAGVGVGTALVTGTGVGALLIPVAIETVGGAVETHVQTQMMDWLEANKYSNTAEAVASLDDARAAGESRAMIPLLAWAESQGLSEQQVRDLRDEAEDRYGAGRNLVDTDNGRGH